MSERDDEVVSDFDQTNGKAPGLEGDADAPRNQHDSRGVFADAVENAGEVLFGDDRDERDRDEDDRTK